MSRKMGNPNELKVVNIRLVKEPSLYSPEKITTPADALRVIADELAKWDRETFSILTMKTSGQVISCMTWNICSIGTLDSAVVSPREVFKSAILQNGNSFIVIHNHPGQISDIQPSQEDKDVTKRLLACADLMGIAMLDHIIVGAESGKMYSFREEGLLDRLRPKHREWER